MTTSIVEQAEQNPRNSTPVGWDPEEIVYPGVNTCLTVTAVGKNYLVGLHLGIRMYHGDKVTWGHFPVAKDAPEAIDAEHLKLYLDFMEKHIWLRGKGAVNLYVAGAIRVWQPSAPDRYDEVRRRMGVWAKKMDASVDYLQFDDDAAMTVDIHVKRSGVIFNVVHTDTVVDAVQP